MLCGWWEERKVGIRNPSGDTYMKTASRLWCASQKWEMRLERERNGRKQR
jgi:hypothetical protein